MKKAYETPEVEVVKFQYRDQVVAASGACKDQYGNVEGATKRCETGDPFFIGRNNA